MNTMLVTKRFHFIQPIQDLSLPSMGQVDQVHKNGQSYGEHLKDSPIYFRNAEILLQGKSI